VSRPFDKNRILEASRGDPRHLTRACHLHHDQIRPFVFREGRHDRASQWSGVSPDLKPGRPRLDLTMFKFALRIDKEMFNSQRCLGGHKSTEPDPGRIYTRVSSGIQMELFLSYFVLSPEAAKALLNTLLIPVCCHFKLSLDKRSSSWPLRKGKSQLLPMSSAQLERSSGVSLGRMWSSIRCLCCGAELQSSDSNTATDIYCSCLGLLGTDPDLSPQMADLESHNDSNYSWDLLCFHGSIADLDTTSMTFEVLERSTMLSWIGSL
jgi:hypothetical protein